MTLDEMIAGEKDDADYCRRNGAPVSASLHDERLACLRAVKAELEAARAVVAKLPMLADGTRFVPGMTLYAVVGASVQEWHGVLIVDYDYGLRTRGGGFSAIIEPEDCYSTREGAEQSVARAAAEAAREAKERPCKHIKTHMVADPLERHIGPSIEVCENCRMSRKHNEGDESPWVRTVLCDRCDEPTNHRGDQASGIILCERCAAPSEAAVRGGVK